MLIVACGPCRFTEEDRNQLLQGKLDASRPGTVATYRSHIKKFEVPKVTPSLLHTLTDEDGSYCPACQALIASHMSISKKRYNASVN